MKQQRRQSFGALSKGTVWRTGLMALASLGLTAGPVGAGQAVFKQVGNILVMSNTQVRIDYNLGTGTANFFLAEREKALGFHQRSATGNVSPQYGLQQPQLRHLE